MLKKNTGVCLYKYESNLPPCLIMRIFKYGYLKDFLSDNNKNFSDKMVSHTLNCIEFKGDHIDIKNENCINCMFCVFGCPGNKIEIRTDFYLKAMCSNFQTEYENKIDKSSLNRLFMGSFLSLPSIKLSQLRVKFKSFKEFTEKDETKNISVWGANTLKYLSKSSNPRIGLEIGMIITKRDRGGRLDICLLNDDKLFVAEAKVSFTKLMEEGRYISQLLAYDEEIKSTLIGKYSNIRHYKFLLIGGSESDLLPQNHQLCTSKTGNLSDKFYHSIIENNFFFISANALLALGLLKLFYGEKYSLENICNPIFSSGNLGLLTNGIVTLKKGIPAIVSLDDII